MNLTTINLSSLFKRGFNKNCLYKLRTQEFCSSVAEEKFQFNDEDDESRRQMELDKKRNKSRLSSNHYNILHGKPPYKEPVAWFHHSVKYKKRSIGKYGLDAAGDVPLGIMWPTKEELDDKLEFERCYRPDSLQRMIEIAKEEKESKEMIIKKRQEEIAAKLSKLEQWKKELKDKEEKKERDLAAAQLKKERLIEEVRRHFGYKVDPREEKFKEMLIEKEKQEKRLEKAERKKQKQDKMLQFMLEKQNVASGEQNKA